MVKIPKATSQNKVQTTAPPPTTDNAATGSKASSSNQITSASASTSSNANVTESSSTEARCYSGTTAKKKTKSVSKTKIIDCNSGPTNDDDESDGEAHYDLQTCIQESGGLFQFLNTPCMILYKNDLKNQSDLENFVLEHLSSYKGNVCWFAGIKGTDEMKNKINEFYRLNRKQSMKSTILFKGHSGKSTTTQQIFLRDGHLYLYVDAVMKNKTARNKKRKICTGSTHGVFGEACGKFDDHGANRDVLVSTKDPQSERDGNKNNKKEKTKSRKDNNGSSAELEDEGECESSVNEDENSEEETNQINTSTGHSKRGSINWKGGSKNTGVYVLYEKKMEVKECVNNVLSYAREHGTLLSGAQLKTILDIENVEITKDRANGLVQIVSKCVDIVTNPHFVPPTTKRPVYEYYGRNYELTLIHPIKPIPVPSTILEKYHNERDQKEKAGDDRKNRNKEESQCGKIMEGQYSEGHDIEDNVVMEVDDKEISEENNKKLGDDETHDQSENSSSQENSKNFEDSSDKKSQTMNDNSGVNEESIEKDTILIPSGDLEETSRSNCHDHDDNSVGIIPKQTETQVDKVVTQSRPSVAGKTNSTTTTDKYSHSSQLDAASATISDDQYVLNHGSKSTITSSSISPSSNSIESTIKIASPLEKVTPAQPKQKKSRFEKVTDQIASKDNKRRSFFLRSKTKKTQQQQPPIAPSKRQQDDEYAYAAASTISLKKKKLNSSKNAGTSYKTLTKVLGKIPKKKANHAASSIDN